MRRFAIFDCDPGEARTLDPLIKSQLLYQLSYGVKCTLIGVILKCDAKVSSFLFPTKFFAIFFTLLKFCSKLLAGARRPKQGLRQYHSRLCLTSLRLIFCSQSESRNFSHLSIWPDLYPGPPAQRRTAACDCNQELTAAVSATASCKVHGSSATTVTRAPGITASLSCATDGACCMAAYSS